MGSIEKTTRGLECVLRVICKDNFRGRSLIYVGEICNTLFLEWFSQRVNKIKDGVFGENPKPQRSTKTNTTCHGFYGIHILGEHHDMTRRLP